MFTFITERMIDFVLQRPALLRQFTELVRGRGAVVEMSGQVIVVGYKEATDVLARKDEFVIAQSMRQRILTGDFLLNMDDCQRYREDKALLQRAFYSADFDLLEILHVQVANDCRNILDELTAAQGNTSELDLIGGYTEPVAADAMYQLVFGVDEKAPPAFISALRLMATLIVQGGYEKPSRRQQFDRAAAILNGVIEDRLSGKLPPRQHSVMSQLLNAQCDPTTIKRYLGGISSAGVATMARTIGQAMDELLHRPDAMEMARLAAEAGDEDTVLHCALEALRFNPVFSFLRRHAAYDTHIHTRDGGSVKVAAGTLVSVCVFAAMFDKERFADPERFMINRPLRDYLHFGGGMHRCFGEMITHREVVAMLIPLLRHGSALARGERSGSGYLQYEWPALRHFWVKLS